LPTAGFGGMDSVTADQLTDRNAGAAGRHAVSPARIPAEGWKQVALRTSKESSEDNIGLVSAGVAFYAFLALVPLLAATVLTYGLIAAPATVLNNVQSLTKVMPSDAAKLVGEQLMSVVQTSGGKKGFGLLLALAIALFGARNAAGSVITALNIAYEEEESRGLIKVNLLALAITAAAVLLAIIAMIAVAALGHLEELFPQLPTALVIIGKLTSYAVLLAGAAAGAATLYRYAPDRKKAKWVWITPGSIFAAVGWVLLTLGFGFYAANFADYGKTYGSLATVVVLISWTYLSAQVLLLGAELNSELEHQTVKDTRAGTAEPIGQSGVWSADHVATERDLEKSTADFSMPHPVQPPAVRSPPVGHSYLASRVVARASRLAGTPKVGMLGSAMATIGLSMLRRKGWAGIGAALIGSAAGIALLNRKDENYWRSQHLCNASLSMGSAPLRNQHEVSRLVSLEPPAAAQSIRPGSHLQLTKANGDHRACFNLAARSLVDDGELLLLFRANRRNHPPTGLQLI